MNPRLTLFLTIALVMSPFAGFSPFASISNWDKEPVLPQEQHPVETRTSNWPCWFDLTTCPDRSGNGNEKLVLPEEQLPTDTQHRAFNWRCWIGLSTCHVTMEDGDQKRASHEQQLHMDIQLRASSWPCHHHLSERPRRIRFRASKVVNPEEPKQQSPGPRQKVFGLLDTLGHLWDNLDQRGLSWILMKVLEHICSLSLLSIACGIWRRVRRQRGQETGPTASASERTEQRGKDDSSDSDLLHQMEANINLLDTRLRTLFQSHEEACRSLQESQAAQDSGKNLSAADSTSSTG